MTVIEEANYRFQGRIYYLLFRIFFFSFFKTSDRLSHKLQFQILDSSISNAKNLITTARATYIYI